MTVGSVDVVNWNPRRNRLPGLSRFPVGRRVNNFGDLIGPLLAERLAPVTSRSTTQQSHERLLAVGSILHFAHDGDHVWGSGVNGKIPAAEHLWQRLDVRAVRGPLTREWLRAEKGIEAPAVYGDPALLLPDLFPDLRSISLEKRRALAVVPNLHDSRILRRHPSFVDPRGSFWRVLKTIAQSERVIGSSLHGVIIAEALGIPAVLVTPSREPAFKYLDYAMGTGRTKLLEAATVDEADHLARTAAPAQLDWNSQALHHAFPLDLWSA